MSRNSKPIAPPGIAEPQGLPLSPRAEATTWPGVRPATWKLLRIGPTRLAEVQSVR